jgi:hypothetical protein
MRIRGRFAPLHLVADALIDYLEREYDVEVIDDLHYADDLWRARSGVTRAVRVTPAAADTTPITFVFTDYPGVVLHAGLVHDFFYPICGCDACDETWSSVADDMEFAVEAVVTGGYSERITREHGASWIWSQFGHPDGPGRGGSVSDDPPGALDAAAARLRALPDGRWAAWPGRTV